MFLRKTFHLLSPSLKKYPFRNTCAFSIDNPRFNPQKDYYQILNLSHHASKHQINDAYANLANLYYSDRDKGVGTRFGDITEAYRVLSDDTLREQYDSQKFDSKHQRESNFKKRTMEYFHTESPEAAKLTPEEKQYYGKFNKYLKRGILVVVAYFMFSPFFTWSSSPQTKEEIMNDPNYAKRRGGMYFNRPQINNEIAQRNGGNPQNQQWNSPPGVIVTGQIVQD